MIFMDGNFIKMSRYISKPSNISLKTYLMKAAWGSVETAEYTWENPSPTKMYWRPDKVKNSNGIMAI